MSGQGRERNEELQRYFDGELSAEEAARLESSLSDDDRRRLDALGDVRAALVNTFEAESEGIDLWAGIQQSMAAGTTKQATTRRWRERVRTRRAGRWMVAVAAVAAALAVLLRPAGHGIPTDECDVVELEVDGAVASVLKGEGMGGVTVIWAEELPAAAAVPQEDPDDEEEDL